MTVTFKKPIILGNCQKNVMSLPIFNIFRAMKFRLALLAVTFSFLAHGQGSLLNCSISVSDPDFTICPGEEVIVTANIIDPTNYSLRFNNPGQLVNIPHVADYDFPVGTNFSVEFWMRTSATGTVKQIMFARGDSAGQNLIVAVKNGQLWVEIEDNTGVSIATSGNLLINDDNWHHVAVVIDRATNMDLYVDGQVDGVYPLNNSLGNISGAPGIMLGAGFPGASSRYYFNGFIDEVRVWDQALTPGDVQSRKDRHLNPNNFTTLVGYWDLNEGSGVAVIDCSPNANTGTLDQNPSFSSDVPTLPFTFPVTWNDGQTTAQIFDNPTDSTGYAYTAGYCKYQCYDSTFVNVVDCDTLDIVKGDFASVWAPNAFSPNGDVKNETFAVQISEYVTDYEITIFNRLGDRLFQSKDVANPWDGTNYNGDKVDGGVYVYHIRYANQYNEYFDKYGYVLLYR